MAYMLLPYVLNERPDTIYEMEDEKVGHILFVTNYEISLLYKRKCHVMATRLLYVRYLISQLSALRKKICSFYYQLHGTI